MESWLQAHRAIRRAAPGLANPGANNCFANSALQALWSCGGLREIASWDERHLKVRN